MCVDLFLKAGAETDSQNDEGMTALMYASDSGHHECVVLLLKAGANMGIQGYYEWTALMYASKNGHHGALTSSSKQGLKRTPKARMEVRPCRLLLIWVIKFASSSSSKLLPPVLMLL